MSEKLKTYWCERCSKKYFYKSEDDLITIERSYVQKKPPHIDHDNKDKKTKPVYIERNPFFKCKECGYILKRIKNEK